MMNEVSKESGQRSANRNPYTLWFVVLAFVAPVALAYIMFFFVEFTSFTNHGELLKPMIQVTSLRLKDESDVLVPEKSLTFKWRFISFVDASCDTICRNRLIESRQILKTLGKDQHRVLQVLVTLNTPDSSLAEFIKTELPAAIVFKSDPSVVKAVLPPGNVKFPDNDIFIQDPMGNIMMRFTRDQPVIDIQYDIRKLLKASQIG